ncbi:hypothetical protein [Azospirillum doebereinerae]
MVSRSVLPPRRVTDAYHCIQGCGSGHTCPIQDKAATECAREGTTMTVVRHSAV